MVAPIPANEPQRLAALAKYQILDTIEEQAYDDIIYIASQICGVPMAMVSFIDKDRQWLKAKIGCEFTETPRSQAFCAHAILDPENLLLVPDAQQDQRFADNPLVTDGPHIRFYAGAPLVAPGGLALGTLCVIDKKPRELSSNQRSSLAALSRQVVAQLELRRALEELATNIQERISYEERLESYQRRLEGINASLSLDSQTDKLTGLSNRRHFDEILGEEFERALRRERPLSTIMVDVDNFKSFNDSFGHSAGDETLKLVAKLLDESKRPADYVARYGGEEFIVLLPNTTEEGALILAERLRRSVQNHQWKLRPITVSMGVCTYSGGEHTISNFVEAADSALYLAKANGRNRVQLGSLT
jgi:diguanylate cyclase (GGDEF)-like protein